MRGLKSFKAAFTAFEVTEVNRFETQTVGYKRPKEEVIVDSVKL